MRVGTFFNVVPHDRAYRFRHLMGITPINVALVITELEVGGAERCLVKLAEGLDRNRFRPRVFALAARPRADRGHLADRLDEAGVAAEYLGFTSKWRMAAAVRRLASRLRETRVDLIQSMLFHANVIASLAVRRTTARALSLGIRVADPSRGRRWIEGRIAHRADRVTCVSQRVAEYAAERMRVPREKLVVIPNGVDVQDCMLRTPARLESLGVASPRRAIVCVSRLAPQKGVDRLIRVSPLLCTLLPDHDLVLVGEGPDEGALKRLAAQLGVQSRVHFAGWRADVCEILLASDLMLLPSRWEGMPNVLLEAMACERPVTCTRVEGVQEVLGSLSDAQTVPPDNAEALVTKAVAIIQNPSLARQLGRDNRRRVADQFSWKTMIQSYEKLFDDVLRTSDGA